MNIAKRYDETYHIGYMQLTLTQRETRRVIFTLTIFSKTYLLSPKNSARLVLLHITIFISPANNINLT